jgi:hypothetical protein
MQFAPIRGVLVEYEKGVGPQMDPNLWLSFHTHCVADRTKVLNFELHT